MNIDAMLAELRQEVEAINEAIALLERIASTRPRGRGRPPKWFDKPVPETKESTKKRSLEARMRMAEAQRRRRAAEKAASTKSSKG